MTTIDLRDCKTPEEVEAKMKAGLAKLPDFRKLAALLEPEDHAERTTGKRPSRRGG